MTQPPVAISLPPTAADPNAPIKFTPPTPVNLGARSVSGQVVYHQGESIAPLDFGWTIPTMYIDPRMILAVRGLEKSGKDHFALTSCLCGYGPTYLLNIDFGTEGVSNKFLARGGQLYEKVFRLPKQFHTYPQATKIEMAEQVHEEYLKFWYDALNRGKGTLVVDTHSEEWEIRRLAKFGKLTQIMPTQYTEVNNAFRSEVKDAYDAGMSVVFLQKQKPEYVSNTKTGKLEPSGYNDVPYLVQANLETFVGPDNKFYLYVHDNRLNMEMKGMTIDIHGKWNCFGEFMTMTFGEQIAPLRPALGDVAVVPAIAAPVFPQLAQAQFPPMVMPQAAGGGTPPWLQ